MSFRITREQILQGSATGGHMQGLLNKAADDLSAHRTQRLPDKLARVVVASLPDYASVNVQGNEIDKNGLWASLVDLKSIAVYKIAADTYNIRLIPIDVGVDA